jgi:hypothetical protein
MKKSKKGLYPFQITICLTLKTNEYEKSIDTESSVYQLILNQNEQMCRSFTSMYHIGRMYEKKNHLTSLFI